LLPSLVILNRASDDTPWTIHNLQDGTRRNAFTTATLAHHTKCLTAPDRKIHTIDSLYNSFIRIEVCLESLNFDQYLAVCHTQCLDYNFLELKFLDREQ
jgi:hypothetical protein